MSRYYTVCAFTPSSGGHSSRRRESGYLYKRAPNGFLFHDSAKALEIADLRLPMRYLAELFDEAKTAVVVRVNANTLALTFSTAGIPTPVTKGSVFYPGGIPEWVTSDANRTRDLTKDLLPEHAKDVWIVPDVTDPKSVPQQLDLIDRYDHCTQLMRLSGNCPCPLVRDHQCLVDNVLPVLPEAVREKGITLYEIEHRLLRRVRYQEIASFKYVSGKATDDNDFATTFRPWNDYSFEQVDQRTTELKARGIARHLRNKFKESDCKECAYRKKYAHNPVLYDACGSIRYCKGHVKEADAWALLYHWLHHDSGFLEMPGFTAEQRISLMRSAGSIQRTNIFTPFRRTPTVFGGFMRSGNTWFYRMVPEGGDLKRYKDFTSFSDLQVALRGYAVDPQPEEIPIHTVLACAIFGHNTRVYLYGKGTYERRTVKITGYGVETVGANARYESGTIRLTPSSSVADHTYHLWGYQYGHMAAAVKKLHERSAERPDVSLDRLLETSRAIKCR
jgi:hypothetical protein